MITKAIDEFKQCLDVAVAHGLYLRRQADEILTDEINQIIDHLTDKRIEIESSYFGTKTN